MRPPIPHKVLEVIINAGAVNDVKVHDILSPCRKPIFVDARHMAMKRIYDLAQKMPKKSRYTKTQIGIWIGQRDHTSVIHAIETCDLRIEMDEDYASRYSDLCKATEHIEFGRKKTKPTLLERVNMLNEEQKREIENYLNKINA